MANQNCKHFIDLTHATQSKVQKANRAVVVFLYDITREIFACPFYGHRPWKYFTNVKLSNSIFNCVLSNITKGRVQWITKECFDFMHYPDLTETLFVNANLTEVSHFKESLVTDYSSPIESVHL